jgi:hypothetical protein
LSVDDNKKNITRRQWMTYAAHCKVAPRAAERVLRDIAAETEDAAAMIGQSALPEEMRRDYEALIRTRSALL